MIISLPIFSLFSLPNNLFQIWFKVECILLIFCPLLFRQDQLPYGQVQGSLNAKHPVIIKVLRKPSYGLFYIVILIYCIKPSLLNPEASNTLQPFA